MVLRLLPAGHPQHRAHRHVLERRRRTPSRRTSESTTAPRTSPATSAPSCCSASAPTTRPTRPRRRCRARTDARRLTVPDELPARHGRQAQHATPARSTTSRPATSSSRRGSAATAPTSRAPASTSSRLIHNFSTASTPGRHRGAAAASSGSRRATCPTSWSPTRRPRTSTSATTSGSTPRGSSRAGGEHQLKFGYQTEKIYNDVAARLQRRPHPLLRRPHLPDLDRQTVRRASTATSVCSTSRPSATVESRNDALFIQDTWRVTPRLTLNLGVRSEHERIPNFGDRGRQEPDRVRLGRQAGAAARLRLRHPTGDAKWKLYGSYGKYYDVMKYEMPRGSFGGDKWVDYFYTWDNPNFTLNASGCATGIEHHRRAADLRGRHLHRAARPALQLGRGPRRGGRPQPQADGGERVPDRPHARAVSASYVVGARYIYKNLVRTIEDVGIVVPGIGEVYYIANPGEGISLTLNDPSHRRASPRPSASTQALELTFQRRFSSNWGLFASYTYSRLYGNYSGLASSDENGRTSPERQPVLRPHREHVRPQRPARATAGSAPTGRTCSRGSSSTGSTGT